MAVLEGTRAAGGPPPPPVRQHGHRPVSDGTYKSLCQEPRIGTKISVCSLCFVVCYFAYCLNKKSQLRFLDYIRMTGLESQFQFFADFLFIYLPGGSYF